MKNVKHPYPRFAPWAMALALLVAADVVAQAPVTRATVATGEDMRLWSFGDCDRRFPYVETDTHKECVRVVGSPEARDARALHVCEVSHITDHAEIERCKATYQSNKEKAARGGIAANGPAAQLEAPSPEDMRRVKAISSAAIEENRPTAAASPAPRADLQEPVQPVIDVASEPSLVSKVGVVLLLVALVGLGAGALRRRQAQSA